jgi:4-alpha-glucanotransferase
VATSWRDAHHRPHRVAADTLEAVLAVLGAGDGAAAPPEAGPLVATRGEALALPRGEVLLEGGGSLRVSGALPPDIPLGYHRLRCDGGEQRTLIVGPGRCHLPAGLRAWGWAVQLYAVHSARSWGMGDLGDLGELARWARGLGAGLLLLNPLHYSTPRPPVQPSPYSPGSRRFRDPIWLRVEDVPGAAAVLGAELDALAGAARSAGGGVRIDRDAVLGAKLAGLRRVWEQQSHAGAAWAAFAGWRREQDADLEDFGAWCALAEVHGTRWRDWPAALQSRGSAEFAAARAGVAHRAGFHIWLQWLVQRQVEAAGAELPLLHDLAIGVDPDGVEAWLHAGVLAASVHAGAPPDLFNALGQDWGILPFDPWRLRAAGYAPFAATLRACMRGGGGLRVDHVMGLSRLFWVPPGGTPLDGTYVRYPARDLLEILALESVRAGALVVGEDLGTVEPRTRRELAARDILSYRLLWFETAPPRRWPERALAAVTTHDLPTVAGLWTGSDLRDQEAAGTAPDAAGNAALRRRVGALTGLPADAPASQAVLATYAALAQAPCMLLVATLEDLLAVERRPNMPGTTAARWPSWSVPLPRPLDAVVAEPRAAQLARLLGRG